MIVCVYKLGFDPKVLYCLGMRAIKYVGIVVNFQQLWYSSCTIHSRAILGKS